MTQATLFEPSMIDVAGSNDDLATPPEILARVEVFWPDGYDLDPATNANALTRPKLAGWTIADDCFSKPTWAIAGRETRIWMNPPYSNPKRFIRWLALACWDEGCEALAIVKSDHSTEWWDDACSAALRWCALRRRPVHYLDGARTPGGGKFASDLFYFQADPYHHAKHDFDEAFGVLGRCFDGGQERPTWMRE